jgi:hypothetical protein
MANTTIVLKKSGVPGNVPSTLANGELSINYADGKLFYRAANGTISTISGSGGGGSSANSFATINSNSSLILATSASDTLTFTGANGISITTNTTSKTITIGDGATQTLANSKMYAFFQNTAPSTANSHDLWMQSDSGVVYENWGTTSTPVWAEFGPTNFVGNTQPGAIIGTTADLSQINVSYTPATTVNTAIQVSAANTKGGNGYADFLTVTNISGGATNPKKYFRLNSTGTFEIINNAYSSAIFTITDGGSLTIGGSITPTTWTPGQVIKDTMLSNSEITVATTTVATSTSDTDFMSYSYTPVSASSYLIIHVHVARYDALTSSGAGTDSYFSRIKVDGTEIVYGWQYTRDTYTFRTGTLFPLIGRYTNSNTSAKSITVGVRRDTADDNITIVNSPTALWMRITEVAR